MYDTTLEIIENIFCFSRGQSLNLIFCPSIGSHLNAHNKSGKTEEFLSQVGQPKKKALGQVKKLSLNKASKKAN